MQIYYRHQLELLRIDMQIAELALQKSIWEEIDDNETVLKFEKRIFSLEAKKENYLNNLFLMIHKTEINCAEIKQCYQLLEKNVKTAFSTLFTSHLNRTIEAYQKKHGSYLIKSQIKKAYDIEKTIQALENV